MNEKKLPIGYYLKKADNLLTDGINRIHSGLGLTRTDWQVLKTISESDIVERQLIYNLLTEFETIEKLNNIVSTLIKFGLVAEEKYLKLTDRGKEVFQTCLQKQAAFRQKSMNNISEQEYFQVITTLEKIINNLSS